MAKIKFNLKIFQIDKLHYEFVNKNTAEIIDIIRQNHKRQLYATDEDIKLIKPNLKEFHEGGFSFYSYCYNQPKDQNYWKLFLPDALVRGEDFNLTEFSFVLFIVFRLNIYCVIGGSGISVIKKYIDDYFGIDLYQHFADPNKDISIMVQTRGVTGNLTQRSNTYNTRQSIKDSLVYSEIPKKLKLVVREELLHGIFKKYNIDENHAIMEIGSFFALRKKMGFDELKMLIHDIHNIFQDKSKYINLSLFNRVKNEELLKQLDDHLMNKIVDDIVIQNSPYSQKLTSEHIIEVVNYKRIERFYECNRFRLHFRKKHLKSDKVIFNRNDLYKESIRYIYENQSDLTDRFSIKQKFYELSIVGLIDEKELTFDPFYNHIVCELSHKSAKYFRIDNTWFSLDDSFLKMIKQEAMNNYRLYELQEDLLKPWSDGEDEDSYNKKHKTKFHFIFDKRIKDNIEICDILYLGDSDIYFIHVKDGFNTDMRSLSSQVTLSSQRLWNDINNVSGSSYFLETVKYYNKFNPQKKLKGRTLYQRIVEGELQVHFVMAYRNHAYKGKNAIEKIGLSQSNIAKFSLVQTVNELINFKSFKFHVIDISQL